jgi:hypothetical protein
MKIFLRSIKNALKYFIQYLNGEFAYQSYLDNFNNIRSSKNKMNCQNRLNKKQFLKQRQIKKYSNINRCC